MLFLSFNLFCLPVLNTTLKKAFPEKPVQIYSSGIKSLFISLFFKDRLVEDGNRQLTRFLAMATISELNFNLIGTIAAFASTIGFALQSLYTKKSLRDLNIHPHVLLQHLTFYGLFMILSLWIFTDMPKIMEGEPFLPGLGNLS